MANFFICPKCEGHLKVGDYLIFATRAANKQKGLLMLHPELGNYTSIKHPTYKFDKGEVLEFFCPICHASLTSDINKNLVQVQMIDPDKKKHSIYFSKIAGEYSSYKVSDGDVMCAGEHSDRYTYFKCSPDLIKYFK